MATREPAYEGPGDDAPRDTAHPSPHRHRVPGWLVSLGLFGAPAAWSVQSLLDAGLASWTCYPKDEPLSAPLFDGLHATLLAANVVALIVCIAAGVAAFLAYRRSGSERAGSAHHLLESGDGRTRFLALAGVLTSVLFVVAVVFETFEVFMVPPCQG